MILGMTPAVFVHVVISLIGIGSGAVVMAGLLGGRRMDGWTAVFLATTVATSATGFLLPADHWMASHTLSVLSLLALAGAIVARYAQHMAGIWRAVYVILAVVSLYFNVFVLVVQSFMKVPPLHDLAPTQSEPPFLIAQTVVLVAFIVLGFLATRRFKATTALAG